MLQSLVEAICDLPDWMDSALFSFALLALAAKHWLGARRICAPDGRVRQTTAEALTTARLENALVPAGIVAAAIALALLVCDDHPRADDGEAMPPAWGAMLLVFLALIGWSSFGTVAVLLGRPAWPWDRKAESDEFVVWKQRAFAEYAKKTPYPGTPAARQPTGR